MKQILIAMSKIIFHLYTNLSNYLLLLGVCLIGVYIKNAYGLQTLLLFVGVISVMSSIIIELNKLSNNKR